MKKYDELHRNATDVIRTEGSNIDRFTVIEDGSSKDIAICRIGSILPFTYGDFIPQEGAFEDTAHMALAMAHLNTGKFSVKEEKKNVERIEHAFSE